MQEMLMYKYPAKRSDASTMQGTNKSQHPQHDVTVGNFAIAMNFYKIKCVTPFRTKILMEERKITYVLLESCYETLRAGEKKRLKKSIDRYPKFL